jgi:LysM repeat protein
VDRTTKICIGLLIVLVPCAVLQLTESLFGGSTGRSSADSATATVEPTVEAAVTATTEIEMTMVRYRIRPDETLSEIAQRFDVTVEAIMAESFWVTDPNIIQAGWPLYFEISGEAIPAGVRIVTLQDFYYEVQKGDNLTMISREFCIPLEKLKELNPEVAENPNKLSVGCRLHIKGYR